MCIFYFCTTYILCDILDKDNDRGEDMDYDTFKLIHSELIMSVQYIEQDLRIVYSTIKPGDYDDNFAYVDSAPLGKLLKEFHELDGEVGYSKIKGADYELLDEIREI